jgi:DNA-binding NarL/FixJ family response regulator
MKSSFNDLQWDIISLTANGYSNAQIAVNVFRTERAVKWNLSCIYRKLRIAIGHRQARQQLTVWYWRNGYNVVRRQKR